MCRFWPVVVTFAMFVGGAVLTHYNKTVLGLLLMLAGLLIAWTWALWPDIRNWLKNRKKGH